MNRDNRRLRLVFALLIVTSLTLLTVDLRGGKQGAFGAVRSALGSAFSPAQRGLSHVFSPVGDAFAAAFHAHRDQQRIDALEKKLATVQLQRDQDAQLKADTPELEKLGQLNFITRTKGVAGKVIARGSPVDNFESTVTLDIGSVDKVEPDLPVIDQSGLIGRVLRVTPHSAIVLLIDDPLSTVEVDQAAPGASLIANVTGQGPGKPLAYDQIQPAGAKFIPKTGTAMYTVETSSYLAGLPVGAVSGLTLSGTDTVGFLAPIADVDSSTNVEVVLSQASNAPRPTLVPQRPPASPAAAQATAQASTGTRTATPASPGTPTPSVQPSP